MRVLLVLDESVGVAGGEANGRGVKGRGVWLLLLRGGGEADEAAAKGVEAPEVALGSFDRCATGVFYCWPDFVHGVGGVLRGHGDEHVPEGVFHG